MNQETIENHIKSLSKNDFDGVVTLVVDRFFGLIPIDVDGKGDGGSDLRIFSDNRSAVRTAIQKTVSGQSWETKAYNDALRAKQTLSATQYFFFTSLAHESSKLLAVQSNISTSLGIHATCLGATEIAGIIVQQGLIHDYADVVDMPKYVPLHVRPAKSELLLHAYVALGEDRAELREEIYDDTILLALHLSGSPLDKVGLVSAAAELVEGSTFTQERLAGRIDSLGMRGRIVKDGALYRLSEKEVSNLRVADGIYLAELGQLAGSQAQLLHDTCGINWTQQQSIDAATVLARCFVHQQLKTAELLSLPMAKVGLTRALGDPDGLLRRLLLEAGVPPSKLPSVMTEFAETARSLPIIAKLARAVTYVATEGVDVLRASRSLGASAWSEITVTLDASVAIPFLCSSMFSPTSGRFSRGATECVSALYKTGAKLRVPREYLNEIASHLRRALSYPEYPEFQDALEHSRNGFVSHYYQLKATGAATTDSLSSFVEQFSHAAKRQFPSEFEATRAIMAEIQPILFEYGIEYEETGNVRDVYRRPVEDAYSFRANEMGVVRPGLLIEHDVNVLSNTIRCVTELHEKRMCLTWDQLLIAVAKDLQNCGLVISPHEAADIIQPRLRLSEAKLAALAHGLAKVRERPSDTGARILDRIVHMAGEKLQEFQFRGRMREFYSQLLARIDTSRDGFAQVDKEVDEFLLAEGVQAKGRAFDGVEL